ncbi:hypothetical protein DIPPA_70140 [Diplonema papillatum]|nr:hypothetical protein DIPPA_70140 [Diplonema papillatum]
MVPTVRTPPYRILGRILCAGKTERQTARRRARGVSNAEKRLVGREWSPTMVLLAVTFRGAGLGADSGESVFV